MEKSISGEVEPVQSLNIPLISTVACGFALFWSCFYTMLMRNSFMDGDIEILWYHLFLRISFLVGGALACIIFANLSDRLATQKGLRIQRAGVGLFSLVAATGSIVSNTLGSPLPLVYDLFAWGIAGLGLTCLLMLWVELLSSFERKAATLSLAWAVILGACAYLIMNALAFPFNIALLCISPLVSMAVITMLERSGSIVSAPYVTKAESRSRARISFAFKAMTVAYGIVLGLGIGLTTQIEGGALLYSGIALAMILGTSAGILCIKFSAGRVQQNGAFQVLFPVLIILLIPMSFLQGIPANVCNLLLLGCYTFFEMIGLYVGLYLAQKFHASSVILVACIQACLYIGVMIGHVIGLFATISGLMDYPMLSVVALALVVVLAVMITFFGIGPLPKDKSVNGSSKSGSSVNALDVDDGLEGDKSAHEQGRWKTRCNEVAKESGLSARETEVFMLLAKGRGIEHIQGKLCISSHTVKSHIYNIYRKLGIGSREELLDLVEGKDSNSCP